MSESKTLASALAKAQAKIQNPVKKHSVDFQPKNGARVKYSYADLADVLASIRSPLAENDLALYHTMGYENGMYGLKTALEHGLSGQKVETWYPLPDPARDQIRAQEFGSALTYARRYSVSSLVGITSEDDDDGQIAAPTSRPSKPFTPQAKEKTLDQFLEEASFDEHPQPPKPTSKVQELRETAAAYKLIADMPKIISKVLGTAKSSDQMTDNECQKVINYINMTQTKPNP